MPIRIPDIISPKPERGLGVIIQRELEGKKRRIDTRLTTGAAAILTMSDCPPAGFYETLYKAGPDGYIVGVGIGGLLTLLSAFPGDKPPKGIISIDTKPEVVLAGKLLVEKLVEAGTRDDFVKNFFMISREKYVDELKRLTRQSGDKKLRDDFRRATNSYKKSRMNDLFYPTPQSAWYFAGKGEQKPPQVVEGASLVIDYVLENLEQFRILARSGKMAMVYGDITDPAIIETIGDLPNFFNLKNLIYLSNVRQMNVGMRGNREEELRYFEGLRIFERGKELPIVVDSVSDKDGLLLRMSEGIPRE